MCQISTCCHLYWASNVLTYYGQCLQGIGDGAVTLLLLLGGLLTTDNTEGLVVALVQDGLLEAVAEHCLHTAGNSVPYDCTAQVRQ